ncbi:glutamate receptor 2-like isoform X1 [Saccostrea echinata]|uniref:glutamate receptor 2-like isoform X1 n=1 Tax=Saccostrea echinata TaxID=191078 RepID=UPI002A8150DB|nr:glutamate receptor 2-like isoform X1 [Saccostrea echinata]
MEQRFFWFVIGVTLTLCDVIAEEPFLLKIGVVSTWKHIFTDLLQRNELSLPCSLLNITTPKPKSQYDKMLKVKDFLTNNQIDVILGPYDDATGIVAEKLKIPYICTTAARRNLKYTFQILPPLEDFSQAIFDMTKSYGWDKVSLFYDDTRGVYIMEQLLTNHDLMVKSWHVEANPNPKVIEKQVRDHLVRMRQAFVQKSIIFCSKEHTEIILDQARSLAMLSQPSEWFFYDPGDQLVPVFKNFPDVFVNFTVFGLMEFDSRNEITTVEDARRLNISLAADSLKLVNVTLPKFSGVPRNITATTIAEELRKIRISGYTGDIEFGPDGRRYNYTIKLSEIEGLDSLQRYSSKSKEYWTNGVLLYHVGVWKSHFNTSASKIQFEEVKRLNRNYSFPLKGRTVSVVMILEKPFTMRKRDYKQRLGNDRFEGFAVDLITEVAKMLDFNFEIYLVHDGKFGTKMENGEWNGMIGELLSGNATMLVAPLSINSQREEAVDFTKPFMTRYISVLMRVPQSEQSYFEFLNPLHQNVWYCTFGAFVMVSVILYFLERFGIPQNKEYPAISFRESFWFVFGSLLQGNTDASPSTLPGRILTSAWWFFALILISSYTANLAAFLTVKKINTPIKSVTDLASQTKIKYGTVKSSGIMFFFKNTNIEHFAKMWAQMSEVDPSSMVDDTEEGFKKVKQGNYAFFWDTTVNKYKTIEDCQFMEIGPHFDPKGFGIGVPPGAIYREDLSMAILRLSDTGMLHQLENKWWPPSRSCPDLSKPSADETSELSIDSVAGVFFILLGGIALAGIVCGFEHFAKVVKKAAKTEKNVNGKNSEIKERESFL